MPDLPAGLVLAAGRSTRMGRPKALLPVAGGGESFVARVASSLREGGLARVVVVTSPELEDAVRLTLRGVGADVCANPEPDRGQLSTLVRGLDEVTDAPAVMMTLVDVPLVQVETVRALIDLWLHTHAPIVRPVFGARHGHPVIFGRELFEELRDADPATGAKPVVRRWTACSVDLPVDDPGILTDVDTPDDYARLLGELPG